tara:strand:+ start:331 stop:732 length:402 start_codon:yes stop_codon:yes gene_type:complete
MAIETVMFAVILLVLVAFAFYCKNSIAFIMLGGLLGLVAMDSTTDQFQSDTYYAALSIIFVYDVIIIKKFFEDKEFTITALLTCGISSLAIMAGKAEIELSTWFAVLAYCVTIVGYIASCVHSVKLRERQRLQ